MVETDSGFSPFAINTDGQLFLGDASSAGISSNTTLSVYEYNGDGSLDTSFGTSGAASKTVSGERTGVILQMLTDGQIVIGAGGGNLVLVRFNANGSLDTTFGTSGVEIGAAADGGFSMTTAPNGETIMVGQSSDDDGIILQEFNTLAKSQRLYVEQDADYDVTSLTDSSGTVVERYEYDPYGNVTVLSSNGTVRGDGTIASSFYSCLYTFQGLRDDVNTGLLHADDRDEEAGRWAEQDPTGSLYLDGMNLYEAYDSNPVDSGDSLGLWTQKGVEKLLGTTVTGLKTLKTLNQVTVEKSDYVRSYKRTRPSPGDPWCEWKPFDWGGMTDRGADGKRRIHIPKSFSDEEAARLLSHEAEHARGGDEVAAYTTETQLALEIGLRPRPGFVTDGPSGKVPNLDAIKKYVSDNYPGWYAPDPCVQYKLDSSGGTLVDYGQEEQVQDWKYQGKVLVDGPPSIPPQQLLH